MFARGRANVHDVPERAAVQDQAEASMHVQRHGFIQVMQDRGTFEPGNIECIIRFDIQHAEENAGMHEAARREPGLPEEPTGGSDSRRGREGAKPYAFDTEQIHQIVIGGMHVLHAEREDRPHQGPPPMQANQRSEHASGEANDFPRLWRSG